MTNFLVTIADHLWAAPMAYVVLGFGAILIVAMKGVQF